MQEHTEIHASKPLLNCAGKILDLSSPKVMGILNLAPNSFSPTGRITTVDEALKYAELIYKQGAAIIDVGGEATNPGVYPIATEQEELDRVIPVVEALAQALPIPISVDTSKPAVMKEAILKGAGFINDIRALLHPESLPIIAKTGVPVCLMHMVYPNGKSDPEATWLAEDPIQHIIKFLQERIDQCLAAGISKKQIVIDPGVGHGNFGKTQKQNLQIIHGLEQFKTLPYPLLLGVSQKTFLGEILQIPPKERLAGSLAAATIGVMKGASIIRAHDVKETVEAIKVTWEILFNAHA